MYSFSVSQSLYVKRCSSTTALMLVCCGDLTEGRVKWLSCRLVSTEKEQKSSCDWSMDSLMERVLSTQLIVGLISFNQGSPRIMFSFLRLKTRKVICWAIPLMSRNKMVENQITPLELIELSAFCAWIGVFRRWVGSLCFLTNPQEMQEMLAPLSMRAQVSTAFIVCKGIISWTGICIVGEDFTNTFTQETEGRVCIGEHFLSKNPEV